jgi:hypothetical protein
VGPVVIEAELKARVRHPEQLHARLHELAAEQYTDAVLKPASSLQILDCLDSQWTLRFAQAGSARGRGTTPAKSHPCR